MIKFILSPKFLALCILGFILLGTLSAWEDYYGVAVFDLVMALIYINFYKKALVRERNQK